MSVPFTGREESARKRPLAFVTVNNIRIHKSRCIATNGYPVVTMNQLRAIRTIAGWKAINIERESVERFGCTIDGITSRVASLLIDELKNRRAGAVQELGRVD